MLMTSLCNVATFYGKIKVRTVTVLQHWLAMMQRSNLLVCTVVLVWRVCTCSFCTYIHFDHAIILLNCLFHRCASFARLEIGGKHVFLLFCHDLLFIGLWSFDFMFQHDCIQTLRLQLTIHPTHHIFIIGTNGYMFWPMSYTSSLDVCCDVDFYLSI
jgi:hypothetical protein